MNLPLDTDAAYRAVAGRDTRWDGYVYLGVVTTGIYCKPSCPARTPHRHNCRFFPSAAAAVSAGFRACRRCHPEAVPGTRDWDHRHDLATRAVRLISEGALDHAPVADLAQKLAVSERHLRRILVSEAGATPQQLGSTRRAQSARMLLAQTRLPISDIAFAAGFGSLRQFNDVMMREFGATPSQLRRHTDPADDSRDGRWSDEPATMHLHLPFRLPFAAQQLHATLTAHAIAPVEEVHGNTHRRAIDAPQGPAIVEFLLQAESQKDSTKTTSSLPMTVRLTSLADMMVVLTRMRRWLDLDADPRHISATMKDDTILRPLVRRWPGLRVPGAVNGAELAVCAVLGQQVSVAAARTLQGRLADAMGTAVGFAEPMKVFPSPATIAESTISDLRSAVGIPRRRAETVHALAATIADGLEIEPGVHVAETRERLLAIPGIGPWTVDYIAMRALRDPDVFLVSDLVARRALARHTFRTTRELLSDDAERLSNGWSPWRSYALQYLWTEEVYA